MQRLKLASDDGHEFEVFRADPAGQPRGAIVVLHAVYGLTPHMGDICQRWARNGYVAIAPALYDRIGPGIVHEYSAAGARAGSACYGKLPRDAILSDIAASVAASGPGLPKIVSGFCTGGTYAWIAASRMQFSAQVTFYGSQIVSNLAEIPRCPTILHYGDADHVVSQGDVERIEAAHPDVELHIYPGAGHAFMNREQATYHEAASQEAWQRSLAFLDRHLSSL